MAMTRASRAGVPLLVTSDWLASHLGRTRVLDTTWYMPIMQRDARAEHEAERIPGSRFLSVDEIDDTKSGLPHMLPSPAGFRAAMDELGVANDDHVVVYDSTTVGCASHRAFWTFLAMGHERVSILDGGLGAWKAAGHEVERGPPAAEPESQGGQYTARPAPSLVTSMERVASIVSTSLTGGPNELRDLPVLVDARSSGRYAFGSAGALGRAPLGAHLRRRRSRRPASPPADASVTAEGEDEPWRAVYPRIRRGRIPNSLNVPHVSLLEDGRFKDPAALKEEFAKAGLGADSDREVVLTCGSGVTAASLFVGLMLCGHERLSLYDGSWCQWGNEFELPVESGPVKVPPQLCTTDSADKE